jgi:hypothetical protein
MTATPDNREPERRREADGARHHAASWLAWALATLTIVSVCFLAAFTILYRDARLQELPFLVGVVVSALVGAVIASRRLRNPIGWFFVLSSSSFALSETTLRYAVHGVVIAPGSLPLAHAMAWPSSWLWVPGIALVLVFLPLYFPNGRLLSPRWRPVLWLAIFLSATLTVLRAFAPGETSGVRGVTNPLGIGVLRPVSGELGNDLTSVLFLIPFLASLVSLVVRFWRSRGEERQQMKWITYAAGAMFTMVLLVTVLDVLAPNSALAKVINLLTEATFASIPVAVGTAVLKYRLYDIDLLINRTLVYGALTGILALVYFGGVTATQAFLQAFTDQERLPQLVIVASTLAIAALFSPLRRRIQSFIDRRFYRRKYDAVKTLEAFNARLRDETELETLSGDVVGVVRETMQPAHVSMWLKPARTVGGTEEGVR